MEVASPWWSGSGWAGCSAVGRSGTSDEPDTSTPRSPRPTKKQRQFLATLPPDPPLPTIEDLVAEELEETGAGRIAGADALQPPVALKVFRRDAPAGRRAARGGSASWSTTASTPSAPPPTRSASSPMRNREPEVLACRNDR